MISKLYQFIKYKGIKEVIFRLINIVENKSGINYLKYFPVKLENVNNNLNNKIDNLLNTGRLKDFITKNGEFNFHKAGLNNIEYIIYNRKFKNYKFLNQLDGKNINKIWSLKHWSKLSIYKKDYDCRIIWELNRLYILYKFAFGYLKNEEEKYLEIYEKLIEEWIANNPPESGINWVNNLEIAIRSINIFWSFLLIIEGLDKKNKIKIEKLLTQHLKHLYKHINYTKVCITNNHLLGESAVLFYFGKILDNKKYIKKGKKIFFNEIERQFYDDGVNFEGSTGYHKFAVQFLVIVLSILDKDSKQFKKVSKILYKSLKFLQSISDENYIIPKIGDWDGGNVFKFNNKSSDNMKELIGFLNLFEKESVPESVGYKILFGNIEKVKNKNQIKNRDFQVYTKSGYIVDKKYNFILFRAGRHGLHGHCDQLSFVYKINGREFLIDPGSYIYNNKPKYRKYFRSTEAHNTLKINDIEQSEQLSNFQWAKTRDGKILNTVQEKKYSLMEAQINYGDKGFYHKRILINIFNSGIIVIDLLKGKNINEAKRFWHVNGSWNIKQEKNSLIFNIDGEKVFMQNIGCTVFKGNKEKFYGLRASEYANLEECYTLVENLETDNKNVLYIFPVIITEERRDYNIEKINDNLMIKFDSLNIEYKIKFQ